jgi:hypothetical protein
VYLKTFLLHVMREVDPSTGPWKNYRAVDCYPGPEFVAPQQLVRKYATMLPLSRRYFDGISIGRGRVRPD